MLDMVTQIFGKAVRNGSRTASQQQLHAHWASNDIGRANDHRIQAVGINIVTLKQRHNTAGRTGTQAWRTLTQTTDIIRMETVYVFIWRDTLQHFNVVDTCR